MAVFRRPGKAVMARRRERGASAMTYRRDVPKVLAVLTLLLLPYAASQAQDAAPELPTEPILRIETGKHGAPIRRIDTDVANRFAVTASDDKTVRVWSLPEGRPIRVLRLPLDQRNIGQAKAVAISPDGTTVAVGGITGTTGHVNILLFDRVSGVLK
jgi:WD40 repeat protein